MKILAVDPGSYEVGVYDGEIAATFVLDPSNKRRTTRPARLAALAEHLTAWFLARGPYDFVAYEEQFVRGGAATKALFGAVGVIEAVSHSCGAGCVSIPQATLRKWAQAECRKLGEPAASPKDIYAAVARSRAGNMRFTEHENDAICVYYFISERGES